MTVAEFMKGVTTENCIGAVYDSKGNALKSTAIIKTGDKLLIRFGTTTLLDCTIILYGDVTCDGKINALDFVYIKRHVWDISLLNGASFEAAEVGRRDGVVNGLDFVYIKRHVWNIAYITQE